MGDLGRGLRGLVMIPWLMAASVWSGLAAMPWALWVTVRWLGRRGPLWGLTHPVTRPTARTASRSGGGTRRMPVACRVVVADNGDP